MKKWDCVANQETYDPHSDVGVVTACAHLFFGLRGNIRWRRCEDLWNHCLAQVNLVARHSCCRADRSFVQFFSSQMIL
jgi:hypothetical protein